MILPEQIPPAAAQSHHVKEPLSKDELNALRYACGYIPHALLKKFKKRSGGKFDECLGNIAVQSEHDSESLLDCTKE